MPEKLHSTNYLHTFIAVADDCPAQRGEAPPLKGGGKTLANLQYEILCGKPYQYTSDDVIFSCFAIKQGVPKSRLASSRRDFFSKGQPCFRASPLVKRYGWGVHSDAAGKIAIVGRETEAYARLVKDPTVKLLKGMRSTRA